MSTGDWDLFLGPLEWARAETGGADRGVLWWRRFPGVASVNKVTPVSLGYTLSVLNKKTLHPPNAKNAGVSPSEVFFLPPFFLQKTSVVLPCRGRWRIS